MATEPAGIPRPSSSAGRPRQRAAGTFLTLLLTIEQVAGLLRVARRPVATGCSRAVCPPSCYEPSKRDLNGGCA